MLFILQVIFAVLMFISYIIMIFKYIKCGFDEGFMWLGIGLLFYVLQTIMWILQKI